MQAVVLGALEPEWEARFEPKSYDFRPGRGCHDAIEAIFCTVAGPNPHRRWILDAELAAAFDRIDHQRLLAELGSFPARDMIAGWLKAGVIEDGMLTLTREGTRDKPVAPERGPSRAGGSSRGQVLPRTAARTPGNRFPEAPSQ